MSENESESNAPSLDELMQRDPLGLINDTPEARAARIEIIRRIRAHLALVDERAREGKRPPKRARAKPTIGSVK